MVRSEAPSLGKFLAGSLILFIAVISELQCKNLFGWSPDFTLVTLLVFSFYFGFFEIAFLGSLATLLLNWKPAPSFEIAALIVLPLITVLLKDFLPWRRSANGIVVLFFGLLFFYSAADISLFAGNFLFILGMIGVGTLWAAFLASIFRYYYELP